jgi:hypothetical protein
MQINPFYKFILSFVSLIQPILTFKLSPPNNAYIATLSRFKLKIVEINKVKKWEHLPF